VVAFQRDPFTLGVVGALVTVGGIGFAVLSAAWMRYARRQRGRLPVQVKIVLAASVAMVTIGWAVYAALEWETTLAGLPPRHKLVNALFQSVTLRTAGFNSVGFEDLRTPTALVMMLFMFIGASPGGTGGGIKTTTMVMLLGAIPAIARGETRVRLFGRTVPQEVVYRCAAIAVITSATAFAALFVLTMTHDLPLTTLAFEAFSAIGTVGLSVGATSELLPLGKYVVIVTMFVGRTGPLTMALSLGRGAARHSTYPEESVAVG